MKFYLGTHQPHWLATSAVPLFVSHRRLVRRVSLPRAATPWALDSGAFSELSAYGKWRTSVPEYVNATRRYRDEIGKMDWAAPMDWMCEPEMLRKTGLNIDRHQGLTVENFSELREHAPDVPWIPVLQGWTLDDYSRCVARYYASGIDLRSEPIVGLGSVCRRQGTDEIRDIVHELRERGLNLHGFGVKAQGLKRYASELASADSMAWSYDARRSAPLPGCTHKNCANCWRYAMGWRGRLIANINKPVSMEPRRRVVTKRAPSRLKAPTRRKNTDGEPLCELCGQRVHNGHVTHPCCEFWIRELGHATCTACREAKRLNMEYKRSKARRLREELVARKIRPTLSFVQIRNATEDDLDRAIFLDEYRLKAYDRMKEYRSGR